MLPTKTRLFAGLPVHSILTLGLLSPTLFNRPQAYPEEFSEMVLGINKEWILVDEVQKVPVYL